MLWSRVFQIDTSEPDQKLDKRVAKLEGWRNWLTGAYVALSGLAVILFEYAKQRFGGGCTPVRKFNDWFGDKLALWLSTMGCFYLIFALVIVPLFFQHPTDLVSWVQYIVQSIFQGVALPVLGYVARVSGEKSERVLNETHDTVMDELALVKEELTLARQERDELHSLVRELHTHIFHK